MKTLIGLLAWILRDFGPLVVFYGTNHFFGFVPAIVASIVWAVADVAILKVRGQEITAFLKFSISVTLIFGAIDLWLRGPFLFRYESVLSNVVTGVFFGLTLRKERPIIQEFAERRAQATGKPLVLVPDTVHYFRVCSAVWTLYFFLKAVVYGWVSWAYDLEKALAIRVVVGNVSFYALLFASIFLAKPIIGLLRRLRLAPSTRPASGDDAAAEPRAASSPSE